MRSLLVAAILITFSCNQKSPEKAETKSNHSDLEAKTHVDTCACIASAVELAINYQDPIDLAKASKEINDSCKTVLSTENALSSIQACEEVQLKLKELDSVKMSEFIQNSRFLLSNIADMP